MDGDSLSRCFSTDSPGSNPPTTNLDFDLGMTEFFMTQSSSANESQVGKKRCATSCEMDDTTNKK